MARGAFSLVSANVFAQALALLIWPVIARKVGADAIGAFAMYSGFSLLVSTISSLRIEAAIATLEDDGTARAAAALACLTSGLIALLSVAGVAALSIPFASLAVLRPHLLASAVSMLATSATQTVLQWALRRREYRVNAWARIVQAGLGACAQYLFVALGWGTAGLVWGDALGRFLGLVSCLGAAATCFRGASLSVRRLVEAWHAVKEFRTSLSAGTLLSTAGLHSLPLLLPLLFGTEVSGHFFLAYRLVVAPTSLVGIALGQLITAEAAQLRRDGRPIGDLALGAAVHLCALSAPAIVALAVFGEPVATWVFGPAWRPVGKIVTLLAPMAIAYAVASPLSGLLVVGREFRDSVVVGAVEVGAKLFSCAVGAVTSSFSVAMGCVAVSSFGLCLYSLVRFFRAARADPRELARLAVPSMLAAIVALSLLRVATRGLPEGQQLGAAFVGVASVYGVYAWKQLRRPLRLSL